MDIGGWIRDNNATITASADMERYDAIKVTVTTDTKVGDNSTVSKTATGSGDAWSFDQALAYAIDALDGKPVTS